MEISAKIAVIGDIHLHFDGWDLDYFNQSTYNLCLCVGDLSELLQPRAALMVADKLSKLQKPAVFVPGNHDVHNVFQIIAEVFHNRGLASLSGIWHYAHHQKLVNRFHPVRVSGYSLHPYRFGNTCFDLIVARPYAMGGSSLSYASLLRKLYRVQSLQDSSDLLCRQVDAACTGKIIFLAHNGPWGLGQGPADIWGCDFDPDKGDFGDKDLSDAIQYAISKNKRVLAVIAGHMHLQTFLGPKPVWKRRGTPGPMRPWSIEKEGIFYINAARVPRIFTQDEKIYHHHISLEITNFGVKAIEKFVERPVPP